jgi:hypothetical protein
MTIYKSSLPTTSYKSILKATVSKRRSAPAIFCRVFDPKRFEVAEVGNDSATANARIGGGSGVSACLH